MGVLELLANPAIQQRFFFLARRFVAGETIEDALRAVAALNAAGMRATLDFLGEYVVSRDEAAVTREAYRSLLAAIRARGADANVSVKLTALGLLVDEEFAFGNLCAIIDATADNADPFVRIDMEGSAVTDRTLSLFERAYTRTAAVGPVLQAYLKRTPADLERVVALGARVRLCKGAYHEAAAIAHRDMTAIRAAYLQCAYTLLERGRYPAIATHDERLIGAVQQFARERRIAPDRFEFQLLFGVRPDIQRRLVRDGWRVRVYVPFGTHWAGYFYRRLAERRENAWFALRSLLGR